MKSIRCSQCGLLNWETAQWCKRCKGNLRTNPFSASEQPAGSSHFNKPPTEPNRPRNFENGGRRFQPSKQFFDDKNGFIARNIARCHRNILIVCVLTIVALVCTGFLNGRYLYNAAFGPFPVSNEELQFGKNRHDAMRYYVRVTSGEVFDTGAEYVSRSKYGSETVQHKYYALQIGDKLLLTKVAPGAGLTDGAPSASLTGALESISDAERNKILEPLFRKQPELRSEFLPYVLDARGDFHFAAYVGIGIGLILLLVAGGFLLSVLDKFGNLEKSSLMKSLAAYGAPREVAAAIDAEALGQHEKVGSIHLLPSWIIKRGTFSLEVQNVEDVVWMYKKITKHYTNFIPTGKTYEVVIHNQEGKLVTLSGAMLGEKKIDLILENVFRRVPWIITGYEDDLVNTWNADAAGFIQAVKERRRRYMEEVVAAEREAATRRAAGFAEKAV